MSDGGRVSRRDLIIETRGPAPRPISGEEPLTRLDSLVTENAQLREALASRIVIEQAKGVLAERLGLSIDDAFLLLRRSARSAQTRIHDLAHEVIASPSTPAAVVRGMAGDSRLRAAAMRERSEATRATNTAIKAKTNALLSEYPAQAERVESPPTKPVKARVQASSRDAAVDLAARLNGHRWYMIVPDEEHWEIVIELTDPNGELLPDLHQLIRDWLTDNSIPATEIRIGDTKITVTAP